MKVRLRGDQIVADWVDIAGTDPTLPFLSDRIAAAEAAGRPLREEPLPPSHLDGAAPLSGMIFHTGRCGSTLISHELSRLARCHVISEPAAVNSVLSVDGEWPFAAAALRRDAVDRAIAALGRAAQPGQDRLILKLSAWNALHLPLLETVSPAAPLVFAYREPEEILVSLRDRPPGWAHRATDPIRAGLFLGVAPTRAPSTPLGFIALVVSRVMTAVADSLLRQPPGRWLLTPYASLPAAIVDEVAPHFAIPLTASQRHALSAPLDTDVKEPARPFVPDAIRKRAAVTPEVRTLVRDLLREPYERLERLRVQATSSTR